MSTKHASTIQKYSAAIKHENRCLDRELRRRWGVTFVMWKLVMAFVRLFGVGVGMGALYVGADPELVILIVGAIIVGPDAVETILTQSDDE